MGREGSKVVWNQVDGNVGRSGVGGGKAGNEVGWFEKDVLGAAASLG